jgi:NAD(P)-dependent dehydrogenase (short-subunit alcohol dehydrogenase family)
MTPRLTGRTALVTGSTAGIGAATAAALAEAGAHVVVSGRDAVRGTAVVDRIRAGGGKAELVTGDLRHPEQVRELAAATLAVTGRIDVLVNNAALITDPSPTADVPAELLDAAFAVSVRAPFLLTGLLAPAMAERGDGAIVNIGSITGLTGAAGSALYNATKATIHSLTKSWAAEYGPAGVRVNTVAPGPTRTEWVEDRLLDHLEPMLAAVPSRRASTPAEIAAAVVFLATAGNVHGALLSVDGGMAAV